MTVQGREITEQVRVEEALRRAEEQLRQARKMEAMGRLAAGVAHDFNNLLTVITGYASLLTDALPVGHHLREPAEEIAKAADRASELTRQLLAFSRKQPRRPAVLDLNAIVGEQVSVLARLVAPNCELIWQPTAEPWPILADASQMGQIVLNLVVNARDAMTASGVGGGPIVMATDNLTVEPAQATHLPALIPGAYVRLTVTDHGCGMDEATLTRIFEPFFTTKPAGQGTGLGLSTVYGIVKAHGGFIYADSSPGQGSTFAVYLPRTDGVTPSPTAPPTVGELPRGTETVLLVEPTDAVRDVARRVLQYCGYTTLDARNAAEARHLFDEHREQIRLAVIDASLPDQPGAELARELHETEPELRVLYLSSGAGPTADEADVLEKPFTPGNLARRVRRSLDDSAK